MIKIDIEVDPISTYITMLFDHLLTKNQTLTNNVTYGGGLFRYWYIVRVFCTWLN